MSRVGVFSGTFDPPHAGHVWFVEYALSQLGCEEVVILVEPEPRHKDSASSFADRLAMTQQQFADNPRVLVNPVETATQHTLDKTLTLLEPVIRGREIWLLVGGDVFEYVPQWPGIQDYAGKVNFLVGLRSEDDGEIAVEHMQGVMKDFTVKLVASECSAVSSTKLRTDLEGKIADKYLSPTIKQYAEGKRLYED